MFRKPPLWLAPGDRIESEVDGIGTLINTVVAGSGHAPGHHTD